MTRTRPLPRQPLLATLLLLACATTAQAHGNVQCTAVPKEDRRPQMELQRKLEGEGWKVRQVKNTNQCYEVYGLDAQGRRVEAFFDPKSFERVVPAGEKAEAGR